MRDIVTQVGYTGGGGGFLIPLPCWEAKGHDSFYPGSCHKPPFTPHTLRALVRNNDEQVMSLNLKVYLFQTDTMFQYTGK